VQAAENLNHEWPRIFTNRKKRTTGEEIGMRKVRNFRKRMNAGPSFHSCFPYFHLPDAWKFVAIRGSIEELGGVEFSHPNHWPRAGRHVPGVDLV
jgi:hypothetical protein